MVSLRMCMVCREMREKKDLIRVVYVKGEEPKVDKSFKAQGRGAYICKNDDCVSKAEKRKVFERAFSREIDRQLYEQILGEVTNG